MKSFTPYIYIFIFKTKYAITDNSYRYNSGRARSVSLQKHCCCRLQIGNDSGELIAVSGRSTRPGTVGLPDKLLFKTFEVPPGHSRAYDSEYKILEEVALRYFQTPEVQGNINLWTEREPCDSCCYAIEQFGRRFPNITLTVNHTI